MNDMTRALDVLASMRRNDAVGTGVCGSVAFGRTVRHPMPQSLPKPRVARVMPVEELLGHN